MPQLELNSEETTLLEQHERKREILSQEQALLLKQLAEISGELADARRLHGVVHNSTIAITACLPTEILEYIFEILHQSQTLSTTDEDSRSTRGTDAKGGIETARDRGDGRPSSNTGRAEVILSQVCRRWRTVAVGLVSIWSVFWCARPASCQRLVAQTKRLRTYLRRSGQFDLKLYFNFTHDAALELNVMPPSLIGQEEKAPMAARFETLLSRLLSLTVPHVYRWKHFTIVADDTRMKVQLTKFSQEIEFEWAPRLERLEICTGPPGVAPRMASDSIWDGQILGGSIGGDDERCPALKYLRLDSAGLAFCRPWISSLTHLILDCGLGYPGSTEGRNAFKIDWPVLLSNAVLRSPHLESLWLCDDILRKATFPSTGYDPKQFQLDFPSLKHLRLCVIATADDRHSFLYFLLRYVTAPFLESLTLSGYSIRQSPWGLEETDWLAVGEQRTEDVFPNLKYLALIDISVAPDYPVASGAFLRLAWITATVHTLVLSSISAGLSASALQSILLQQSHWGDRQIPLESLWPAARDITANFGISERYLVLCFMEYAMWCTRFEETWEHLEVLRIPPIWIQWWLSRLKQPLRIASGYQINWACKVAAGGGVHLSKECKECDRIASFDEGKSYDFWAKGSAYPIRIEAIREVLPQQWPPESGFGSPLHSFDSGSDLFHPFKVDIAVTRVQGAVTEESRSEDT